MHVLQQVTYAHLVSIESSCIDYVCITSLHSELKYPHTVSRFRCPVCDTINDLKPHVRQQLLNQPLTLKSLKKSVHECKIKERAKRKTILVDDKEREKIYEPVEKLVETVFSSWVCLNHSFSNVRCLQGIDFVMTFLIEKICRDRKRACKTVASI